MKGLLWYFYFIGYKTSLKSKVFSLERNVGSEENFGCQKFLGTKIKNFGPKKIGPKIYLRSQQQFWVKKFLVPKTILGPKNFRSREDFKVQKKCWFKKKILGLK